MATTVGVRTAKMKWTRKTSKDPIMDAAEEISQAEEVAVEEVTKAEAVAAATTAEAAEATTKEEEKFSNTDPLDEAKDFNRQTTASTHEDRPSGATTVPAKCHDWRRGRIGERTPI
eukprot:GHVU01232820.1.p2 GENE.GHVU01232820.1~~GHVU01232820.1.p2  ORF type:complete len:116 (+),score=28.97 GHVU01232820.1:163-510(+)